MLCETAREQLNTLSDGEHLENRRLEFAVWQHCLRCRDCRAYRRQLRRLRQNTRQIPAQIPAALRARVIAQLPKRMPDSNVLAFSGTIIGSNQQSVNTKEITMRKRLAAATGLTLLVFMTGALAQNLLHPTASGRCIEVNGRVWSFQTTFKGEIRFFNAQGKPFGTLVLSDGDAAEGAIDLTVETEHHTLCHFGRHDVRTSKGVPLGYVVLSPLPTPDSRTAMGHTPASKTPLEELQQKEQAFLNGGGKRAIYCTPLGAIGYERTQGIVWKIRGTGRIQAVNLADSCSVGGDTGRASEALKECLLTAKQSIPVVPQFEFYVHGKKTTAQGYGHHVIVDAKGKALVVLDVQPLP